MGKKRKDSKDASMSERHESKKKKGPRFIPLPEDRDGADSDHLSDDDLELLEADHSSLAFLQNLPKKELDKAVSEARKQEPKALPKKKVLLPAAADSKPDDSQENSETSMSEEDILQSEDEEGEAWERGPRRSRSTLQAPDKAGPLPIKSIDGQVMASSEKLAAVHAAPVITVAIPGVTVHDDLEDALLKKALEEERRKADRAAAAQAAAKAKAAAATRAREEAGDGAGALKDLAAYDSMEQRRADAKRAMAVAAQALLSDPEGQVTKQLRVLLGLLGDSDAQVARLAMLSLLAVMKDLIPGYRIRPPSEKEQEGVVVSKEVRKVWDFEAALLKGYQQYLKALLQALKASRGGSASPAHGRIAARCMGALLSAAPHFNYSSDLLQAIVPNMASKDEQIRGHCCTAVATLLRSALGSAEAGAAAVEAVQLVADLVKRRNCIAPPEVVSCLLELSFPEISSGEDFEAAKASRKKKKHKKGKKDEVDRAFLEAQAVTDRDTRRHQQSAALEALFEVYFRVIKTATASGLVSNAEDGAPLSASRFAKRFPLLAPTLEGLTKFAHLISVDYFQDTMVVLEELLASSALPPAERLRCLLTAADILRGQGEALTIDRRTFYIQLYSALTRVALVPLDEESAERDDEDGTAQGKAGAAGMAQQSGGLSTSAPGQEARDDAAAVTQLLPRLLESMILDSKLLDASRQAAFAKRIAASIGAAGDSGTAMGLACVLQRMLRRQPKLRGMLDNEAGGPAGQRVYRPDLEDPAEAGAMAVPLWELSMLTAHYHPHVAQAAKDVAGMNVAAAAAAAAGSGGGTTSAVLPLGTSPAELARQYSTASGGFRPAPKAPVAQGPGKKQAGKAKAQRKKGAPDSAAEAAFVQRIAHPAALPLVDVAQQAQGRKRTAAGNGITSDKVGGKARNGAMRAPVGLVDDLGTEEAVRGFLEVGEEEVEVALGAYYRMNRRFVRNAELRREHALLAAKLRLFHERLQQRAAVGKKAAAKQQGGRKGPR